MAAGAEIIWVNQSLSRPSDVGTADKCMTMMDEFENPSVGWCVGDGDTRPTERAFDDSPFAVGRGFDMIVPLSTMEIEYTTSHGSTGGNENITGADLLAEVERVVAEVRGAR